MKTEYIGTFRGFKVDTVPDEAWAGHITVPESMVEYLEEVEKIRKEYNDLRIEQIFDKRSKNNE